MNHSSDSSIRRFGEFAVDLRARELFRGTNRVELQNRAFQVLAVLTDRPGELVSREELYRALWGDDVVVEFDNNLNAAVNRLRKALGDSADAPRFVETLPGRGYRFVGAIDVDAARDPQPPAGPAIAPFVPAIPPAQRRTVQWALRVAAAVILSVVLSVGVVNRKTVQVTVLPFTNVSGDPAQLHIGEALAGELRAKVFSRDPTVRVLVDSRTADTEAASQVQRLAADYVVMGSAARSADGLRVTALLVDTRTQRRIWGDAFYCPQGDLALIQTQLADKISRHLQRSLHANSGL